MQGVRIQSRQLGFGSTGFTPVLPGEPVFDPANKRFGVGIGANKAVWFPKATTEGDLEFDNDTGLVSSDGNYSLKFTTSGISWKVGASEIFAVHNSGVMIRGGLMMRNAAGSDTVVIGYAHWVAIMSLLWNIKALLRKIVANTATIGDINALFNAPISLNLTTLDPAFPEAPTL
jgi:hypothetical protein